MKACGMWLVADTVDGWQDVERVYIGYPIWWGNAAWPVNAFVEANDFTGKTVIPFCTSASSGWVTAVNGWLSWPEPEIGRKVCDSAPVFQMKM